MHQLCVAIWEKKEWPEDWVKSIFVILPKKGDAMQCANNRTVALISHASKIILKIIAGRMKNRLDREISTAQAGFRPGRGTRDQIHNLKMIMEKRREWGRRLYIVFIDYSKAFDTIRHERLWQGMCDMGFPSHIIELLRKLYIDQLAAVRTGYGMTEWFEIGKGVRQGCILSPPLFNIYSELIMREALDNFTGTVAIGGKIYTDLRYADDVALLAGSLEEMQDLLTRVQDTSESAGLFLNVSKTKVMIVGEEPCEGRGEINNDSNIQVNGEVIEVVHHFSYLGTMVTDQCDDSPELKRRLAIARNATVSLSTIWKNKSINRTTKIRLLRSLVFPIATYGCESWAMKKSDRKRVEAFELWAYRRLLRISWTERKTNEYVLNRIGNNWRLLEHIDQLKLRYFGHVVRAAKTEYDLMSGMVFGKRKRGRQKTRVTDGIVTLTNMTLTRAIAAARDRVKWKELVHDATAGRRPDRSAP